ncbi:MAG: hypothetical protein JSW71_13765 [Gemmatimonadota bacterium]|nr:MAG: hypothetical protein JSW71_13765 [Gemmatimonadota bacterium]
MNHISGCQLKTVYDAGSDLSPFERLWLFYRRLQAAALRRLARLRLIRKSSGPMKMECTSHYVKPSDGNSTTSALKPGDEVEILPFDEIQKLLNQFDQTQGLTFVYAMREYCGTRQRILKRVDTILDDKSWQNKKIKNTVILEGIVCKGKDMASQEGCERCCHLFWKEAWLRKIE